MKLKKNTTSSMVHLVDPIPFLVFSHAHAIENNQKAMQPHVTSGVFTYELRRLRVTELGKTSLETIQSGQSRRDRKA